MDGVMLLEVRRMTRAAGITAAPRSWPAPPAASPWDAFRHVDLPAAARASRKPAPASSRVEPAPRRRGTITVHGVATRFNVHFKPCVRGELAGVPVVLAPRCLDACLAAIRAGRCRLPLVREHGGRAIGWSGEDFDFVPYGDSLHIEIFGSAADAILADRSRRDLSIGVSGIVGTQLLDADGDARLLIVTDVGHFYELAIVENGSCPGCKILSI